MKDKLMVYEDHYVYRIGWYIVEDDGMGATLGEGNPKEWNCPAPKVREDWEHWAAQKAAFTAKNVERDSHGFYWEGKNDATAALRICEEALKQDRPMPEWATKALAEGWKPPKGWKA